jgi:hypothetical protein
MQIELEEILYHVCHYYGIQPGDLVEKSRPAHINEARQMYFYLARRHTPRSFAEIGKVVNRHHATVIHGYKKLLSYQTPMETDRIDHLEALLINEKPNAWFGMHANLGIAMEMSKKFDWQIGFKKLSDEQHG